jgi:hypothetical protein
MPPGFRIFGFMHVAVLSMIPTIAALHAAAHRKSLPASNGIRLALTGLLFSTTVSYDGYFAATGSREILS